MRESFKDEERETARRVHTNTHITQFTGFSWGDPMGQLWISTSSVLPLSMFFRATIITITLLRPKRQESKGRYRNCYLKRLICKCKESKVSEKIICHWQRQNLWPLKNAYDALPTAPLWQPFPDDWCWYFNRFFFFLHEICHSIKS